MIILLSLFDLWTELESTGTGVYYDAVVMRRRLISEIHYKGLVVLLFREFIKSSLSRKGLSIITRRGNIPYCNEAY